MLHFGICFYWLIISGVKNNVCINVNPLNAGVIFRFVERTNVAESVDKSTGRVCAGEGWRKEGRNRGRRPRRLHALLSE